MTSANESSSESGNKPDWTFDELVETVLDIASNDPLFRRTASQYRRGMLPLFPVQLVIVQEGSFPSLPSTDDYALRADSTDLHQDDYIPIAEDRFWYSQEFALVEFDHAEYQKLMSEIEECVGWARAASLIKRRYRFEDDYQSVVYYEALGSPSQIKITRSKIVRGDDGKIHFEFLKELHDYGRFWQGIVGIRSFSYRGIPSLFQ